MCFARNGYGVVMNDRNDLSLGVGPVPVSALSRDSRRDRVRRDEIPGFLGTVPFRNTTMYLINTVRRATNDSSGQLKLALIAENAIAAAHNFFIRRFYPTTSLVTR